MSKPTIFTGDSWIDGKFCPVTFIKAKNCDFKPENFIKILQGDDPEVTIDSEVYSDYMRHRIDDNPDYGSSWWEGGYEKGDKGATQFFYAKTRLIESK